LVALRDGADADQAALRELCASGLARFKVPKEFIVVEQVRRLGNGKADYRWAKGIATQKASV
jgi:fatty-acyl-CoA synthase